MLKNRQDKFHFIGLLISSILFILLEILLIISIKYQATITLKQTVYNISALCGIIAQCQVLILICLVVFFDKPGYITSVILTCTCITCGFYLVLSTSNLTVITGIIVLLGALISTSIIYNYGSRFKQKVAETLKQKEALNQIAWYDSLTSLPNRRKMLATLNTMIATNIPKSFAVVFIDIDNFKKINDTAGHQKGDQILLKVVHSLKSHLHSDDILGRLGGDEFALIITHDVESPILLDYLEDLKNHLLHDLNSISNPFFVSASFGVALYPNDAQTTEQLLKYADTAMYATKMTGKNGIKYFTSQMHEELLHKITLEHHLQNALMRQEFSLVYQPQYTSDTHELRGFEMLLRWSSPKLGSISPSIFIPIAEETGLILPIGEWVLRTACKDFQKLRDLYHINLKLSVNISVMQILEPNFLDTIKNILEETAIPPHCLELEVTESVFISAKDYVVNLLNTLKHMGIQIALDDFGTTYASLSYLQLLPLNVIKIDKSFIDDIEHNKKSANLVHAIITIAQELDCKVVAEGIEHEQQLKILQSYGCDYIQGYLLGKPLNFDHIAHLISQIAI